MKVWGAALVRVAVAAFTLPLVACTLLSPVPTATSKGVLSQLPREIPQRTPHTATLLVLPPETNPIYDTPQMAYVIRPYHVDFFTQHEWGATPAQMLLPLLVRTLERTRYFSAVHTPPYPSNYTYALRTEIIEFSQDFTVAPPVAQLSFRFQLIDGATNQTIATQEVAMREPMRSRNPDSGVEAINSATANTLMKVAAFVLEKIK
ncbi:MAG TPA: ABC-type transport auxiliary lipoprotein family protein [Gammaproteobacteria bacterium]